MRLVQFEAEGLDGVRVGVELGAGGDLVDVTGATKAAGVGVRSTRTLLSLLGDGASDEEGRKVLEVFRGLVGGEAAPAREWVVERRRARLRAPIYDPEKVICVGMNYVDHCTEQGLPTPKEPVLFTKFATCISADGDELVHPAETSELDFEVEMVIVVGKTGRRIRAEDALGHVFGFTVAHDVSARDWQLKRNGGQWLIGKAIDGFCPLGPAIVSTDELGDPHALRLWTKLNGAFVQDSSTAQLVHNTNAVIAFASRFFTLRPGDIILTGTPPGVGCFRKPPLWLKVGDVVEVGIEKIGTLTNKVVADHTEPEAACAAAAAAAAAGGGGSA
jgi:2-keto-4-pentenoate hydratase/2-oxohepta-3-ene-1,7-dioic acid hydratase in catechol pathway